MTVLPEVVVTRLPPGTLDAIRTACERHRITSAEFVRSAVRDRLAVDGLSTSDLDMRALRLPAPKVDAT